MKTKEERIEVVKSICTKWGYQIENVIEADEYDRDEMVYFDPDWAIDEEERIEYPKGREVTVNGEMSYNEEADAVFCITRNERQIAVGLF